MPAFAALRRHRRLPKPSTLVEWAARVGYGARGFVYLSAGLLTLLAATDRIGDAVGTGGAAGWLAEQPFGRLWLVLLGVGLWAFVGWRALQAVFDADHEGADLKGWATRAGQALSGVFYGVLAAGVFEYLDEVGEAASAAADQAESVAENQEKAAMLLGLPLFFEAAVVLMMPIVLTVGAQLARDPGGLKGNPYLLAGLPVFAGVGVMPVLVPPHPGPMVAIDALGADLGSTLVIGAVFIFINKVTDCIKVIRFCNNI
jgi:hypothetical protein